MRHWIKEYETTTLVVDDVLTGSEVSALFIEAAVVTAPTQSRTRVGTAEKAQSARNVVISLCAGALKFLFLKYGKNSVPSSISGLACSMPALSTILTLASYGAMKEP